MDDGFQKLYDSLPDREAAARFHLQFRERHPNVNEKLERNAGLLADVLTLASYSPLLASSLLQHPDHVLWLERKRTDPRGRHKNELMESLARFALRNSQLEIAVLLARFRRRELLRIYLRDIRRLATIAEVTEEISELADAVLEYALRHARSILDGQFGQPFAPDQHSRMRPAEFCIASLGKLGSKELNYSSDIDLIFIYSDEGNTTGTGTRGKVTNREYFVKLSEQIIEIAGGERGEGAAYRVDVRLRPHGRVGPLAIGLQAMINYYRNDARDWEQQVLIRSRACAGDLELFRRFYRNVESIVFSPDRSVETALRNVRISKDTIDFEGRSERSFNVKLGRGGIREIEFIAQALQLAYGGRDKWLRAPHTLISLARLADRHHISESELTDLSDAYDFLRRLEHVIQMEHGLQMHTIPTEADKRSLVAAKMRFTDLNSFDAHLSKTAESVHTVFQRVFSGSIEQTDEFVGDSVPGHVQRPAQLEDRLPAAIRASVVKSEILDSLTADRVDILENLGRVSPHFTGMFAANPQLITDLPSPDAKPGIEDYASVLTAVVSADGDFGDKLSALRRTWSRLLLSTVVLDVNGRLSIAESKVRQTQLAEASVRTALNIARTELGRKYSVVVPQLRLAVLGLGKLGGGGIDYGSDLDIVLVYDELAPVGIAAVSQGEFFSQAAEIFVTAISGVTRDGSLYRLDLRLRPWGKNGPLAVSRAAITEYFQCNAAIWELLAFVKVRAIAGPDDLSRPAEVGIRDAIYQRAKDIGATDLASEARAVRLRLQEAKAQGKTGKDTDIKYGEGGLLDVYFLVRYLQLRWGVMDDPADRSTDRALITLFEEGKLNPDQYNTLREGYSFLSTLDHNLRLTVGRSTRLPAGNNVILRVIADRIGMSRRELTENLAFVRMNIRAVFDEILPA